MPAPLPPILPPVVSPPAQAEAPAPAADGQSPLWPQELVRSLRRVQDRLAAGANDAFAAQRALSERIEREFAAADPSVWRDPRNARAAVTYFLSGGNPSVLRRLMGQQPPPSIDSRLLRGTLAYLEGREEEALRQLSDINPRSLPASLGGQVALAQAALWVRKDPKRSTMLLDVARLLAPGTLVEEAALRRAIVVASQSGDTEAFEHASKQYLFRFRNSVYADNFRQRFASALSRMNFVNDPQQFHRLDDMLKMMEPNSRRDMELLVARSAVVQGKTAAAGMAAQRVLAGTPDGSAEADRARLYRGASLAPSADTYGAALKDLKTVDRDRLGPADVALLDAASATASMVQRAAESAPPPPAPAQPVVLSKEEELPVLERARAALATADSVLKGGPR
ncbi:chemotaxis protein MotC [Aquabacter sp. CN5-332]|uniref:chemotaxis protein MotC n=1 Tax=Aquabacter sp. CN5-332 TaxID=3156608 RepID=UPI0032B5BB31